MTEERTLGQKNAYELCREATKLLEEVGLNLWGRKTKYSEGRNEDFLQHRFEENMLKGAYSRSSESRRK